MDSASIAPIFNPDPSASYFREAKHLRNELRDCLTRAYRLEDFSLFLVPSVTFGIQALKTLLSSAGWKIALNNGAHYAPIEALFRTSAHESTPVADSVITTHVAPYTGEVRYLYRYGSQLELVDASHSFATNLHPDLIATANVFIAPLHKHAALATGIALIAVRDEVLGTAPFNRLELLEQSTASHAPLIQALANLDKSHPSFFNIATIGPVTPGPGDPSLIRVSPDERKLPFACFRHASFATLDPATRIRIGSTYFPAFDTLRIARWARGTLDNSPADFTADVQAVLDYITQIR